MVADGEEDDSYTDGDQALYGDGIAEAEGVGDP